MRIPVFVLAFVLASCGGAGGAAPSAPPPPPPVVPPPPGSPPALPPLPAPVPPAPGEPVPAMLPGLAYGIHNATGEPIVWFGWWETRVPQPVTGALEPGWVWIIPSTGSVAPGTTYVSSPSNGPYPRPQPEDGAEVDVVAVGLSGTTYAARVTYAVPAASVWVVTP